MNLRTKMKNRLRKAITILVVSSMMAGIILSGGFATTQVKAAAISIENVDSNTADGNILIFNCSQKQVMVELCTDRTVRIQLSTNGGDGYRPYNPEYYMVQKNNWPAVTRTVTDKDTYISVVTVAMEIRIQKQPLRIGMYDLEGNLLSKDTDSTGMYWDGTTVGVRKVEGTKNAGGIFGFGSGDHGRRSNLNRYSQDFSEFTMSHGRVIAPFFMSTVGYGIFLNTIEKTTTFYKQGGGFQTQGYLDYFFMYGPDFKTILNEYAEITGRMEMYGKWAHGFMLSKYGNDNATQAEFSQWMNRLRDEGYPTDCYVFDYGWRGDVKDNGGNQSGAGQKWGKQMWSNDTTKFPDIDAMFREARELGFRVGLHNNAGTPEASGGARLYLDEYQNTWVKSYMDSVIKTGYGDWFWPDEFDVLGSNTAPTFSSKGAYEAWKDYTVESRPMFVTRGSYAGQHYATAWSGDIDNTSNEITNQIGFSIDTGLVGYWASSNDLGGFMGKPTSALYTRWVSEFGAWSGIMRTHGHNGREPWLYDTTAQETLKKNLKTRYALYPYIYTMAWQGYSEGVPMMRAMLLEDGSQSNPDAWNLNRQYYFGDWFLVAPAADTTNTTVSVWLPPNTTWYHYYSGKRYEGGVNGKTIRIAAALDEIPVFVKAGAIVPMGPDMDYADEVPLDPLTLDIYPSGTSAYTFYEDDGVSGRYITENAYSTTSYTCVENGSDISFRIDAREDHNPAVYQPVDRSYNLKFNHLNNVGGVTLNDTGLTGVSSLSAYNNATEAYWLDSSNNILYVKVKDTAEDMDIVINTTGIVQPQLGDEVQGVPAQRIESGDLFELENSTFLPVSDGGVVTADTEWKGYTGTGFAKGFKKAGDALEFKVDIVRGGIYDLTIPVNNGYTSVLGYTPRTGGLYLDGSKASNLAFAVTDTWGDASKKGVWVNYTISGVSLETGTHTFRIVAEGSNPGNFNLDSMKFTRQDTSINAFSKIEAEKANRLTDMTIGADNETGLITTTTDGAWAQFNEVNGANKGGVEIRIKSSTGGSIIVYENGVGDKILTTIELPDDGEWHTITVAGKDTDAKESNIFLEFNAKVGKSLDVSVDWFRFVRKIDAYSRIAANTAAERSGIDLNSGGYLNHIENGDWAKFEDISFGDDGGTKTVMMNVAAGLQGGKAEVYIDNMDPSSKIADVAINTTGNWNTFVTYTTDGIDVTGVHDVYFKFVNTSTISSICDFAWFQFSREMDIALLREAVTDAKAIQKGDYTDKSWKALQGAIADAEKEIAKGNLATQKEVQSAYGVLVNAIDGLKEAPVTGQMLSGKLTEAKAIEKGDYTNASWEALQDAIADVQAVLDKGDAATDAEKQTIYDALVNAIDGLEEASVTRQMLGGKLTEAKAIEKGDYTDISWNALQSAITEAETTLGKATATQNEVEAAYNALQAAITGLEMSSVTKQMLIDKVVEAKAITKGDYTDISWNALQSTITKAETTLGKATATQNEIEAAYNALLTAIAGLETSSITKQALGDKVTVAKAIEKGDYSDISWNALQSMITKAETTLGKTTATQNEIEAAYNTLQAAITGLEMSSVTKQMLIDKVTDAKAIAKGDYTDISWNALQSTITKAETTLGKGASATQNEIEAAYNALLTVIAGLKTSSITKQALNQKVADANEILRGDYTDISWNVLQSAIAAAEEVLEETNATQVAKEAAYNALQTAINGLIMAPITKQIIEDKLTEAKEVIGGDYTDISWDALQGAIGDIAEVLSKGDAATQAEKGAAYNALLAAIAGLEKADVTRKDLVDKVADAKEIKQGDYTGDSWKVLQEALTAADEMLGKGNAATQKEIKDAYTALQSAIEGLTLITVNIPTDLKIAQASMTSIRISWEVAKDVDGYEISYAAPKDANYSVLKEVTATTYTHTGLIIGRTYYYKVRAYKTVDGKKYYSAYANTKSITLPVPAATGVKTASAGATAIKVSWGKVSGATGYVVYRSTKQNSGYTQVSKVDSTKTSYISKNLKKGKTYYFRVKAYNKVDNAEKYSAYSSTVKRKAALNKPAIKLKAGKRTVKISWKKVAGAQKYMIYRAISKNGKYSKVATVKAKKLSYTNKKLTKGKKYYYKVRAVQKVGKKTYVSVYSTKKYAKAK